MLYAVGDIHGCLKELKELHGKIMEDAEGRERPLKIVFVGDYVDRGPDSKGVIEFLMSQPFKGFRHVFLKGNHEDMMLDDWNTWMLNGGRQTLESYGGQKAEIPEDHLNWMRNLPVYYVEEPYLFVHAGVDPRLDPSDIDGNGKIIPERQSEKTMMWIRDEFLNSDVDYGYYVVHGHTPLVRSSDGSPIITIKNVVTDGPDIKKNRINLDTGSCWTGVLSCAVLDPKDPKVVKIIDTRKDA